MNFFETVKVENSKIFNIEYHNKRFKKTIKKFFKKDIDIDLKEYINPPKNGLYRCKIIYDENILDIKFFQYRIKDIKKFKIIESDIDYEYKYLDRSGIEALYKQKGESDEIIIVKDGLVTDTSIANIAFFDGKRWITPKKPLLKGTTRERYLENRKIIEEEIYAKDIKRFKKIALLNAMVDFYIIEEGIIIY